MAEHIAVWITMSMKTSQKNPKSPRFTRLGPYNAADRPKEESIILKQSRVALERAASEEKHTTQVDKGADDRAPRTTPKGKAKGS